MEHPEQKLFEEVKGLKIQMNEVRDRIFKAENTYISKVEDIEKREHTKNAIDQKLKNLKTKLKNKRVIFVDGEEITLFKSTLEKNIYKCDILSSIFEKPEEKTIIDLDLHYFLAIIEIIQRGHNIFTLDNHDKSALNFSFNLKEPELNNDKYFLELLKKYFPSSFEAIIDHYNLNMQLIPNDLTDLIETVRTNGEEGMVNCDKYSLFKTKKYNDLLNPKNENALFLDYNKDFTIVFKKAFKTNKIGLRPFTKDTGVFYPTTGSSYTNVSVSSDEKNWTDLGPLPSTYGSADNDYITIINLSGFKKIKYLKFTTNSSAQVSLNYVQIKFDDKK